MSKALDILKKIKQAFSEMGATTYKLADGTEIAISLLETGGEVTVNGAPAPAGDHTLEDGTVITVDEAGIILEVKNPEVMEAVTLTDGSQIQVSSLEVGGTASINGVPAPAGEYTLEDGRTITIDETGNITNITVAGVDLTEQFEAHKQEFSALKGEFNEYKTTAEQRFANAEETIGKQADIIGQMMALVEELAKQPGGDPPATKKVFSFQKTELKSAKLNKFAEAAQKLKEQQAQ